MGSVGLILPIDVVQRLGEPIHPVPDGGLRHVTQPGSIGETVRSEAAATPEATATRTTKAAGALTPRV